MNSSRMTGWLMILVGLSAIASIVASSRATAHREAARKANSELAQVRRDLLALGAGTTTNPIPPTTNPAARENDVNRRIRAAAERTGAIDALNSVEPASNGSSVLLRFEPMTMKQLLTFLHELGTEDRQVRADALELSAAASDAGGERWSATVTLALRPQVSPDR